MRVSELKGRSVLDVSSADEIAKIESVIIDPDASRIVGFRVKGADSPVLRFDEVRAVGNDRVTVESSSLHEASTDVETRAVDGSLDPLKMRVLLDDGSDLGAVDDLEFDPDGGEVRAVHVGEHDIDGARILGIGDYAMVIQA